MRTPGTPRPGGSISRAKLWLLALLAAGLPGLVFAQDGMGPDQIGTIPGTSMTRDEFRARALSQLCAIALNAAAYHAANGEYPADFAHLAASEAWNLEVSNLFDGGRLRDIYFDPQATAKTNAPVMGFIGGLELPFLGAAPSNPEPTGPEDAAGGEGVTASGRRIGAPEILPRGAGGPEVGRIDPQALKNYRPGELLYFTQSDLLQLAIFAPDGTYVEWVDEIPRPSFAEALALPAQGAAFPADIFAKQVLYFTSELLPDYYNLVRFMSDQGSQPAGELARLGAAERLALAQNLGITVLNPVTHSPAGAAATPQPGDFLSATGPDALPLRLCLANGAVAALEDLRGAARSGSRPLPEKEPSSNQAPRHTGGKPRQGGGRGTR